MAGVCTYCRSDVDEHEPAFVRRHGPKLEREIRDATLRIVPDAGHASNLDNPEFFTAALRSFLEKQALAA
jgi:pimeloyl-ACP methyl ester carboxylesterase